MQEVGLHRRNKEPGFIVTLKDEGNRGHACTFYPSNLQQNITGRFKPAEKLLEKKHICIAK